MAKGFLADDAPAPVSTSGASVSIATASTSIATTSTTTPRAPTLINETSPRHIGFDISSLSISKKEEKKSLDEIKPSQQDETPVVVPSAPPITELPSYNTYSITPAERTKIITSLRKAKLAILHSRSKNDDVKGLSEALEEILSITTTASGRMSQRQANEINEEIKKIMIYKTKMKERKKFIQKITNQINKNDCLDIFVGIIMVSRSISDIFCIILTIMTESLNVPSLICLLLVAITGCIFTYLILIGFCFNDYRKIHTKSYLGKIETLYCILYTLLYGILATLVLTLPVPSMGPAICGYVSMVTCILQRCLKCETYSNGNAKSHSNTYENIMMVETGNNITLQCNAETIINITTRSTIQPNNDAESRIAAVENLKIRIQSFLIELLGQEYMHRERITASESNGVNQKNNASDMNITSNYNYTDNATTFDNRTNIVSNTVMNYNSPTHRTDNDWRFFDSWWFWYNLNNPPIHHHGGGGGCCTSDSFCCDGCCICDDGCCGGDSTGNGDCCEGDGNCCEGGGDCCGDGDCCVDGGGCAEDCGSCDI